MSEQLIKTPKEDSIKNESISLGHVKELKGIPTFNNLIKLSIICSTFLLSLLIICSTLVKYKQVNSNCVAISNKTNSFMNNINNKTKKVTVNG